MSSSTNRPTASWQTKESRYYCATCNVWMGNDRQSILVHENGKKHKEKVEASLQERRDNKVAADKQASQLQSSLKAMEQAALHSMATGPDSLYYDTTETLLSRGSQTTMGSTFAAAPPPPPPPPKEKQQQQPSKQQQPSCKKEKQAWSALKKQRQEDKQDGDNDDDDQETAGKARRKRTIGPDEGHYTLAMVGDEDTASDKQQQQKIFLEGTVFAEILEEEMPIQIWLGSHLASLAEKRLPHNQTLWINGLVVAVKKPRVDNSENNTPEEDRLVVDVCYLKNPTDHDETIEQNVRLPRIRILLGADESIPKTLEEARILALGGEEVQVTADAEAQIDEATGLTGWSTVAIKRTTVHQEAREERARERQKQRQAKRKAQGAQKEAETRKMEEAKVANAEDSALGAYDVWGKGGYKGVDIHKEAVISIADTAKKLAGVGEKVAFKKANRSKFQVAGKKRNRRTTSADD
jgi:WW domain-binding protein 4